MKEGVNSNIIEKLMGHTHGLEGAYLKPTKEECFAEFKKAIPKLTISDEARDKLKISKLEEEKSEIQMLKSDISSLQMAINEQLHYRGVLTEFHESGKTDKISKLDPDMLEFFHEWKALKASKKLPRVFLTPKHKIPKEIKQLLKGNKIFLSN